MGARLMFLLLGLNACWMTMWKNEQHKKYLTPRILLKIINAYLTPATAFSVSQRMQTFGRIETLYCLVSFFCFKSANASRNQTHEPWWTDFAYWDDLLLTISCRVWVCKLNNREIALRVGSFYEDIVFSAMTVLRAPNPYLPVILCPVLYL